MITLEQAKEKLEDLKSEIRCRLKCEPEDLEIVQPSDFMVYTT